MRISIRPWRAIILLVIVTLVFSIWSLRGTDIQGQEESNIEEELGSKAPPSSWFEAQEEAKQLDKQPVAQTTKQHDDAETISNSNEKSYGGLMCERYPDPGNIALSIKTGATELVSRLGPLLNTTLSCINDLMIFSDLEDEFQGIKVHDVLSRFNESFKQANPAFELYYRQKELKALGREDEIPALANMPAPEREDYGRGKKAPWALDKYKFVPEVEMAYQLQPGKDWYVFLEGDTYLSWGSLIRWLRTLDPTQKLYIGNAIQKSDDREPLFFAHGGDGFVLSEPAMKEFAVDHAGITTKLADHTEKWWAGDFMLADALYDEIGLKVSDVSPMFNEYDSESLAFGSERMWCQPAITLHHMDEAKVRQIYAKEAELDYERLLLRDVYQATYTGPLSIKRGNWDNIASEQKYLLDNTNSVVLNANQDFESCKASCERNDECFQFTFLNTTVARAMIFPSEFERLHSCYLSKVFRLGHAKEEQSFENEVEYATYRSWTSGWRVEKINEWVQRHQECPDGDHWVQLGHEKMAGGSGHTV